MQTRFTWGLGALGLSSYRFARQEIFSILVRVLAYSRPESFTPSIELFPTSQRDALALAIL